METEEIPHYFFYAYPNTIKEKHKFKFIPGFKSIYDEDVVKVIPKSNLLPEDYKEIQETYKRNIFESDVKAIDRYLWVEKPQFSKAIKIFYFDIETTKNAHGQYSSVDNAENAVNAISFYDNVLDKYYLLLLSNTNSHTEIKNGQVSIYRFTNEVTLLETFINSVKKLDPDCLTGWNVTGFDIPYLINRMKNLNIDYRKLSPLYSADSKRMISGSNNSPTKIVNYLNYIKGRTIMDLMSVSRLFWLGGDVGYSLEAQSRKFLGEGKIDIGDISKAYNEDFQLFIDYSLKDTELCVKLDQVNNLIFTMQSFQDIISINLEDTVTAGKTINYYLKQHSDIVLDNADGKPSDKIPGGYVIPTKDGIFFDVYKFDFASHYPNFIRTYNISPDTRIDDPENWDSNNLIHFYCWYRWGDPESGTKGAVIVRNPTKEQKKKLNYFEAYFRKDKRGLIPKVLDVLIEQRYKYKKYDKAKDKVYKRMLNSFFGQFKFEYSRFYDLKCAKSITLGCQNLTKGVVERIKEKNIANVIMGDTDSFCAKLFEGHSSDELLKCMNEIFDEAKKYFNLPEENYSKLELEDKIKRMILFGVKKKYASLTDEDKEKVQGLELIRKDCPQALKEFQQKVIKYIFNSDNPNYNGYKEIKDDIKDKIKQEINKNNIKYVAIPTVIRKNIEEYENETEEKKALRNSGLNVSVNETFYILPCVGNYSLAFKEKEDIKNLNYKPDYWKCCDKIFKNVKIWDNLFLRQTSLFEY